MNTLIYFYFTLIISLVLAGTGTGFAQTVATGHITAEVIESISASSQAVTNLSLETTIANNIQSQELQTSTNSIVNSGAMSLNSGNTFTVNVVLKSEPDSSSQENDSKTELLPDNSELVTNPSSDSLELIPINGTSKVADALLSGHNHGTYTVVFACN